jgi:drug/metabolite transporter (DMT)-like permease
LVIVGLFLLEGKKPILKWSKGTNYALIASFFWGTSFALFRIPIEKIGSVNFSFSLEFTVCIMAILIGFFTKEKQNSKVSKQAVYTIIVLALLGYLGVVFYNKAITIIPVSTLSIMGTFTPVITIIISHIYLKEKFTKNQYIGISNIIGATLLLI